MTRTCLHFSEEIPLKVPTVSRSSSRKGRISSAVRSLPTRAQLDFRFGHARACDAVWSPFDAPALAQTLQAEGLETEVLATAAGDRAIYLARPDLGRQLAAPSRERLNVIFATSGPRDLALLISDGLAAQAAIRHAVETVVPLVRELREAGWSMYPVFILPFARVKFQDEVGELLGARHAVILLGERPGLGVPDSLGAYLTYQPNGDRRDADRNCVSNIRAEGLPPAMAASKISRLLRESARRQTSGISLKDPALERAFETGAVRDRAPGALPGNQER